MQSVFGQWRLQEARGESNHSNAEHQKPINTRDDVFWSVHHYGGFLPGITQPSILPVSQMSTLYHLVGVGKERRTKFGPRWYLKRQHPLLELPLGLLALCRWTLGSERHRYVIAWPDKLGTNPTAVGGINTWTPLRKVGGISWVRTRFSLSILVERTRTLMWDGTAEPVSQSKILRRERRRQGNK